MIGKYFQSPDIQSDPTQDAIQNLQKDVEILKLDVNDLTNYSIEIENKNNNLTDIIFIGDSYLAGDGLLDTRGDGYSGDIATQTWADLFVAGLPSAPTYKKYANGGMGIVAAGADGNNLQAYVSNVVAPATSNKHLITDVIIMLGINDMKKGRGDILTQGNAAMSYIEETFPNARITVFFSAPYMCRQCGALPAYKALFNGRRSVLCYNSAQWGISNIDWYTYGEYIYSSGTVQDTTGHPNLKGSKMIANNMRKFFQGKSAGLIRSSFEKNSTTSNTISGDFRSFLTFSDNEVKFKFNMGALGTGYDIVSNYALNIALRPYNNITVLGILPNAYLPLGIMFTWDGNVIAYKAGPGGATQDITQGGVMYCSIPFDTWVGNEVE